MRVGIPKESQAEERRVGGTPDTVATLIEMGFDVVIESGAGLAAPRSSGRRVPRTHANADGPPRGAQGPRAHRQAHTRRRGTERRDTSDVVLRGGEGLSLACVVS